MITPGTKLTYLLPLNIFQKASDVKLSALSRLFLCIFSPFPGGSSSKEPTCNAGDVQETRVQSLGQEDPLEQ